MNIQEHIIIFLFISCAPNYRLLIIKVHNDSGPLLLRDLLPSLPG